MKRALCLIASLVLACALVPVCALAGSQEAQPAENSWRYEDGRLIDNPDTTGQLSTLATAYSTWKSSYGSSYLGIVTDDGTTKVAVSGAVRVGIDVSYHNGTIDWDEVADAGVDFAIIRCGYGSDDESQDDTEFLNNVQGALDAGLDIGIYLYSYATKATGGTGSAESEAAHVLRLLEEVGLEPDDLDLPIFYDLENNTQASLGASVLGDIAEAFCSVLEEQGYAVGIYANMNWWENYLTDDAFDTSSWYKWVARYPTSTGVTASGVDDTDLWQFTSKGSVSGIDGNVDVSFDYVGQGNYGTTPAQVTITQATVASSMTSVEIAWDTVANADGYEVYRKKSGGSWSLVSTLSGKASTSYTDSGLTAGATYSYRVRAFWTNSTGANAYGAYSDAWEVTMCPDAATLVSAEATSAGNVALTWEKVSNCTGYAVYRSDDGGAYTRIKWVVGSSATGWTDATVQAGVVYRYKIRSYATVGTSTIYSASYSTVKKVTAQPATAAVASLSTAKARTLIVKWAGVSDADGYQVAWRMEGSSKWYYATTDATAKVISGLRSGFAYEVRLRSFVGEGAERTYSAWSDTETATVR